MFCSFGLTLGLCMSKDPAQAKRGPKLVLLFSDRFGLHCLEASSLGPYCFSCNNSIRLAMAHDVRCGNGLSPVTLNESYFRAK